MQTEPQNFYKEINSTFDGLVQKNGPAILDHLMAYLNQKKSQGYASQVITLDYILFILDPFRRTPIRGPCFMPHPTHLWRTKGQKLLQHGTSGVIVIQPRPAYLFSDIDNDVIVSIKTWNTAGWTAIDQDISQTDLPDQFIASRLLSYGIKISYIGSTEQSKGLVVCGSIPQNYASTGAFDLGAITSDNDVNNILIADTSDAFDAYTGRAIDGLYHNWIPHFEHEFEFFDTNTNPQQMTYMPCIIIQGLPTSELNVLHIEWIFHYESIPQRNKRDLFPGEVQNHNVSPRDVAKTFSSTNQSPFSSLTNFVNYAADSLNKLVSGPATPLSSLFNLAGNALSSLTGITPFTPF